jgi:ABC-type uncharacterized transport system auxiliary subunit
MSIRLLVLLALILTLSACATGRAPVPDTRYYTLEYEAPEVSGQQTKAVIALTRFGVAPEFNTAKMIYRDLSFGRQEYHYHHWRATPQSLVADYLRRDLQQSGLFLAVGGPGSSLPATHQLEGMVEEWMEVDEKDRWLATAELTVTLLDLRATAAPDLVLFQRTYRESEPCAKKNPGSVAEAMSRVMRVLSGRIIADVHAAVGD